MAGTLKKLGELLVEEGAITPEEQELALEAQAIYGGRLGTNLVDLDFLTPEQVGTYLSLQLGVPQAHWSELLEVAPEALALLAKEHCQRYRVLPLGVQGHVLRLAMLDPLDNVSVNELGLLTKMRIAPHVAPEVVLLQALEKHHGIPRDKRFLRVTSEPPVAPPADEEPYRRTPAISLLLPTVGEKPATADDAAEFVDDSTTMEYVDSDVTAPWIQPPVELVDLEDTLAALQRAPDRETAVEHLIDPLRSRATSCALFVVRGAMAVAQIATKTKATRQEIEQLVVPLDAPSLLEQAHTRRVVVQGGGQTDPTQRAIARHLGWEEPEQACVAPVSLGDRVIAMLCVQTEPGAFFAGSFAPGLQRLCKEAAATYGRLVASHKEPAAAPPQSVPARGTGEEEPPTLLDTRFFLTSRVGQCSIATVWRAIDTVDQQVVAVHVLPTDALRTEELQRMTREMAALQKVAHPCLPRMYGVGLTQQDHPYVAMEWLGGTDLRSRLDADPLPPRAYTAAVLLQVSQGLDAAHQHGVLHRDLRPENVILVGRERRRVKLVNFGITREPSGCGDERYCGAPEYRAPETERGPADAAADTYAVGVMAYEMLAGRRPATEAIAPRRPLIDLASVPPLARELIMAALAGDPSARPLLTRLGQQLWEALNDPTAGPKAT